MEKLTFDKICLRSDNGCHTVINQLSGSHQAVVWQSSGSDQAIGRQLTNCNKSLRFVILA